MKAVVDVVFSHLAKHKIAYLWAMVAFVAFGRFFTLSINVSDSLPGMIFLVQKGAKPEKGDLVAFRYAGGGPYERGALFLKRMTGVPGSVVRTSDAGTGYRDYFVDGEFVGRAKPFSKSGIPLKHGPEGIIPPEHYYVAAPNPDSLDSRYALVGWISADQIVGKAYRIF